MNASTVKIEIQKVQEIVKNIDIYNIKVEDINKTSTAVTVLEKVQREIKNNSRLLEELQRDEGIIKG